MEGFIKYSPIDGTIPKESGAYNIVVYSRRGPAVIQVAYFSVQERKWVQQHIEEFGYETTSTIDENYISYYKRIDGVEFSIIPESYNITIKGVKKDE